MEQIKVLLIIVILLLISSSSPAQTTQNFAKQNTWEVGGSVSFSYTEYVSNGKTSDNGKMFLNFIRMLVIL